MKAFMKRIRIDFVLSSLLCVVLGVICIFWGRETFQVIVGTALALLIILFGVIMLSGYLLNRDKNEISAAGGIILTLLGIWIFVHPEIVLGIIPVIMGAVLLLHGFRALKEAFLAKGFGDEVWWISAMLAIISMVVGIVCIVEAFLIVEWIMIFVGIALIYNGISNLWIVFRVSRAEKNYKPSGADEVTAIDVQFKD